MTDRVHGEQHILHRVLNIARIAVMASRKRRQIGGDVDEQPPVGFAVAALRTSHENRPVEIACRGLVPACTSYITALGLGLTRGDEGQRQDPIARA